MVLISSTFDLVFNKSWRGLLQICQLLLKLHRKYLIVRKPPRLAAYNWLGDLP